VPSTRCTTSSTTLFGFQSTVNWFCKVLWESLKEIFQGIAERYELEIDALEVMSDHVHLFLLAPPQYSPSQVVQIFKSVSARELFRCHPELREELWGGDLWGVLCTVGWG